VSVRCPSRECSWSVTVRDVHSPLDNVVAAHRVHLDQYADDTQLYVALRSPRYRYRSRMQLTPREVSGTSVLSQPLRRQDGRSRSCDVTVRLLQRLAVRNFRSKRGTPAGRTEFTRSGRVSSNVVIKDYEPSRSLRSSDRLLLRPPRVKLVFFRRAFLALMLLWCETLYPSTVDQLSHCLLLKVFKN